MDDSLPVGKLPPDLLRRLVTDVPIDSDDVIIGPGIGFDCAVISTAGENYLVSTSDPITFASENAGWYMVNINANDIATSGARPRWLISTLLLPAGKTTEPVVEEITRQIRKTCEEYDIEIIGGHTEITSGLDRPILIGTMMGEILPDRLITPRDVQVDDRILLTKGVPLEATAILSREFPARLEQTFSSAEIQTAREFLFDPGISVLRDATLACQAGNVTGMHDPTEGGLYAALWELAQACGHTLAVYQESVNVYQISRRICDLFDIDPLGAIASGSLLLTVDPADADKVSNTLRGEGIPCAEIGIVQRGDPVVVHPDRKDELYPYPDRDEITKAYE